jgi:hypothetical protein
MPMLGKRKNFIGVSVLNGKRPGRKELPSWLWQEGDSWHYLNISKSSLLYRVIKFPPKRGIHLWPNRVVDEKIVLRLVEYLAPHNIIITKEQIMATRNLAQRGNTVILAPVDRTVLKIQVSDLERERLQPSSAQVFKIDEEAAKKFNLT